MNNPPEALAGSNVETPIEKSEFHISVRDLVEQIERSGDINFRFSSRSSATEGIKGHQRLQKSRIGNYEAEKPVEITVEKPDLNLTISGRVDGYYPDSTDFVVEEIKTIRVDVASIPGSVQRLHWGQVKIYAYLLARQHPTEVRSSTVRLCYFDLDHDREHQLDQQWTATELELFFTDLVDRFIDYLRRLLIWRQRRDKTIVGLDFPYPAYRPGQREMAVSVYKTLKQQGQLVMQAPTGIGKTIASLFPAIKALRELSYEKLFYLSAKTSGQQMAQSAIDDLKSSGLIFRDITLTAKEKICFTPGAPCDAEHCQYARGYYDKLPTVMVEVIDSCDSLRRETIEEIARRHELCPFELSLDLSLMSDVVICDYNYVFDPVVHLRRFFESRNESRRQNMQSRYVLLMDESHNLVDRGRDMFSAEFCKDDVLALRRRVKSQLPLIAKKLTRINTVFLTMIKPVKVGLEQRNSAQLDQCAVSFQRALRGFCDAAEDWLQLNQPVSFQADLLELYFSAIRLLRTVESAKEGYAFLLLRKNKNTFFKLYCLNPGPGLSDGFDRVDASVCFSATMAPRVYFKTLMGIADSAAWYQIESPFAAENLGIFTTSFISTTYKDRTDSLYELVDTLKTVISTQTGNYMVFFPSYAYLTEVNGKFEERYPEIKTIRQTPSMSGEDREAFLQSFEQMNQTQLGFAVMGGVFGEGIDLKGSRLIGAIIVGVGLPQLGLERDLIQDYFNQDTSGQEDVSRSSVSRSSVSRSNVSENNGFINHGFEFAYQYPGMNRVLQTAGRVIRSETDRGVVCLIDHRFNEARYQQLLPSTWQPERARSRQQLEQHLLSFWQGHSGAND